MNMIGHQSIQTQFTKMIAAGTLNHAYVLVGPEHIGKRTFAEWAAAVMLKVEPDQVYKHSDVKIIERAYDEKNERFKRDLSVNEIREAIQFASESSFQGGYKVIIITDADRLNTEAGNALLKSLEEPPSQTIFFLLYQTVGAIMPTIRSRSQIINLGPVSDTELSAGLLAAGYESTAVQSVITLANGRPGLALTWLADPEKLAEFTRIKEDCLEILSVTLSERFLRAEAWLATAKESGGTDELINRLYIWQTVLVPHVFWAQSDARGSKPIDLVKIHQQIQEAIFALRHNAHPRLTIESLLAELP